MTLLPSERGMFAVL